MGRLVSMATTESARILSLEEKAICDSDEDDDLKTYFSLASSLLIVAKCAEIGNEIVDMTPALKVVANLRQQREEKFLFGW